MKTIRGRLLVMLLTGLALVLAAGGATVYWVVRYSLTNQFDAGLSARIHTLISLVKFEPEGLIFERGDAPSAMMADTYFELREQAGHVLKQSANLDGGPLPSFVLAEHETRTAAVKLPDGVDGRALWMGFRPRIDPDDWLGSDIEQAEPELLTMCVAMDDRPIQQALASLLTALMVVGGAVGVAACLLVAVGTRWGLRPLHELSEQLGEMSGATLSRRFSANGSPGELLPVYRELNGMVERVQGALVRERSFVDAAAHELRTPLSELRLAAEVAAKWPDEGRVVQALHEAQGIGVEMERLVESLLLLSRSEVDVASQAIALRPIIEGTLKRLQPEIARKRLAVKSEVGDDVNLTAPAGAVEIIVRNLLENAVVYTPHGGSIGILGERSSSNGASLVISNQPVTLSDADLPRLFEPFWRQDGARSDRKHSGLGLAVVRRIADTTGLDVSASLEGGTLRIRMSMAG